MRYLHSIFAGLVSLLLGMGVTLKNLVRRPVTLQYPHEKPQLPPAFRSAIALVRFDDKGTHDCVACLQCVNICPSFCITVEGDKPEGLKRKRATRFDMDYSLCSLCGLCIDVCPTDTLEYSQIYDVVGYRRDDFVYDLLVDFREGEQAYLEKVRAEAEAAARAKADKARGEQRAAVSSTNENGATG
jgi:NADH-quinone oxidoreductase chain I